jgi:hypothetical protein
MPYLCLKPFATSRVLYLSIEPSDFFFIRYTQLQSIKFLLLLGGTRCQVFFWISASYSSYIAWRHLELFIASTSVYDEEKMSYLTVPLVYCFGFRIPLWRRVRDSWAGCKTVYTIACCTNGDGSGEFSSFYELKFAPIAPTSSSRKRLSRGSIFRRQWQGAIVEDGLVGDRGCCVVSVPGGRGALARACGEHTLVVTSCCSRAGGRCEAGRQENPPRNTMPPDLARPWNVQ